MLGLLLIRPSWNTVKPGWISNFPILCPRATGWYWSASSTKKTTHRQTSLQWCYCVHHAAKDIGNVGILRLQHVATWGKKLDTGCCAIIPWVVSYRYKTKQSKALSDHQRGIHCPKDSMKIHTHCTTICSMTHTNALGQHFLHGTLWRCLLKPPNGLSQESIEGDYRWVGCKGAYKYARMDNDRGWILNVPKGLYMC